MILWETCKEDFRWDGSLRDIYITPASLADWRILYSLLRDFSKVEYSVDGVIQAPPRTVEQVFAVRPSGNPMLRIRVSRTLVVFHFFSEEEIECDIDPREISFQSDLDALLGFVQQVGDITGKRVVITPENLRGEPFISYEPNTKVFQYHSLAV